MSKPGAVYEGEDQEENDKHQAARVARGAPAGAQAREDRRVQRGIQEAVRDRRDDLTRGAGLRDKKITLHWEGEDSPPASGDCRRDQSGTGGGLVCRGWSREDEDLCLRPRDEAIGSAVISYDLSGFGIRQQDQRLPKGYGLAACLRADSTPGASWCEEKKPGA